MFRWGTIRSEPRSEMGGDQSEGRSRIEGAGRERSRVNGCQKRVWALKQLTSTATEVGEIKERGESKSRLLRDRISGSHHVAMIG